MVIAIYHYVEKNGKLLLSPVICIKYIIMKKNPGEPFNIHIQLLIDVIQ